MTKTSAQATIPWWFPPLWYGIMITMFLGVQLITDKDRYFWASLWAPVEEGTARVDALEKTKGLKLTYFTIHLRGLDGAPDLRVTERWRQDPYELSRLYDQLAKQSGPVSVRWKQPWWGPPYYLAVAGEPVLRQGGSGVWLLLSLAPVALILVSWRFRLFRS